MDPLSHMLVKRSLSEFEKHSNTLNGILVSTTDRAMRLHGIEDVQAIDLTDEQLIKIFSISEQLAGIFRKLYNRITIAAPVASGLTAMAIDTNNNPSSLKTAAVIAVPSTVATILAARLAGSEVLTFVANSPIDSDMAAYMKAVRSLNREGQKTLDTLWKTRALNEHDLEMARESLELAAKSLVQACIVMIATIVAGSLGAAYHGYKRNGDSLGYALAWFFSGSPGLAVALAQGYAKPIS